MVWIIQERAKELREARKEPEGWVLKSSLCLNNHYLELKDSGFVYASKSYIVNAEKIIKQSNGEIILEGGQTLSLTRGMKKSFEAEVARYWNLKYKETRGRGSHGFINA